MYLWKKPFKKAGPIKVRLYSICNGNLYFVFNIVLDYRNTLTEKRQSVCHPSSCSGGIFCTSRAESKGLGFNSS